MDTVYSILGAILPLEAYQYAFMKNAFLAILLLTPLLGLLGTMAVNHQMAFFSDALGHSALTGIGLGIILGLRNDLVAMLVFGIIWAILICVIKQSGSASADTVISVFSSTSVAAGLLILARGGKFAKYSSLLIGDILAVTPGDLLWLLLALAMNPTPDLLVLDEPVSGIDRNGLKMFLDTLLDLKKAHHMAILLVSHDLRFVREYADHVVLLDKSVLAQGSAAEVFASPEFSAVFGYSGEEEEAE